MKNEFLYDRGKVIAYDDNEGLCDSVDYQDNIKDIFITEDKIEYLENDLPLFINKKDNLEKKLKEDKKDIFAPLIILSLISLTVPTLTFYLISSLSGISFSSMSTIGIHIAKICTIFFSGMFTLFGLTVSLSNLSDYKKNIKKLNGLNELIDFKKKTLIKEKNKLEELKQDKKRDNEVEYEIKPKRNIDYEETLDNIKNKSELYYLLGYYKDKYIKYYNKGILRKKISKSFDEEDINLIEEHISDKAKSLSKRLEVK